MNYFLGLISIVVCFVVYYLFGEFTAKILSNRKLETPSKLVLGFLMFHFVGFIIGFICILLKASFKTYSILMTITLLILIIGILLIRRKSYMYKLKNTNYKERIIAHLKDYWLVYLLTLLFSIYSITNCLAYYYTNYDDAYYISKIVNLIGTPQLLNEDYFFGSIDESVTLYRLINTYELTYAYLCTVFHISPAFFCRIVMVIQSYYLTFMTFTCFAEIYLGRKYAQYSLLCISILLVNNGYLYQEENSFLTIRMYDNWQFQNAMFYGGSIVRNMMIPAVFIYSREIINRFNIKSFIICVMLCLSFISFSTIALQLILLLLLCLCLVYGIKGLSYFFHHSKNDQARRSIILIVFVVVLVIFNVLNIDYDFFTKSSESYIAYYRDYCSNDTIFMIMPWVFLALGFYSEKSQRDIMMVLFMMFVLFALPIFIPILMSTSFNQFFVNLRTITSLSMMALVGAGILIVVGLHNLGLKNKEIRMMCLILALVMPVYTLMKMDDITSIGYLGSGMSKEGYSLAPIINNDEMLVDEVVEIGEYFDTLPYDNYLLMAPVNIDYKDDIAIVNNNLLMVSNRIELAYTGSRVSSLLSEDDVALIDRFYMNDSNEYYSLNNLMIEKGYDYVLLFDPTDVSYYTSIGYESVLQSSTDLYYELLRVNAN